MISLVWRTYRPGGIGLLVDSLAKQTFTDFEVVIVDDWKERDVAAVREYFQTKGINLRWYGPSKPKCFPKTHFNQVNAINTGLIHCSPETEYIVSVDDFTVFRPGCMERWNALAKDGRRKRWAVTGVAHIWAAPTPIVDSIRTFAKPLQITDHVHIWAPAVFELFYYGMPRELWEEINGMDERMDAWRELPVRTFLQQAELANVKLVVDGGNVIDMLDHRTWKGDIWHINNQGGKPMEPPEIKARSPNCFKLRQEMFVCAAKSQ